MKCAFAFALAALATTAFALPASAADNLPSRSYVGYNYAPPKDWTGIYAGLSLGYSRSTGTSSYSDPFGSSDITVDSKGLTYGAQLGYLYEFNNHFVLGAETDFNFGGGTGSTTVDNCPGCGSFGLYSNTAYTLKKTAGGSVRAVAGYNWNGIMPYVTAGVAYARFSGTSTTTTSFGGSSFVYNTAAQSSAIAPVVGVGLAYKINSNLSVRAEYLHAGYKISEQTDDTPSRSTSKVKDDTFRVGFNYHF